ncbi:MAG: methyltransferase domain-containing protein [Deinococcus sp.]
MPRRSSAPASPRKVRKAPLRRNYLPYELEALGGLEGVAEAELREVPGVRGGGPLAGAGVRFIYDGEPERLSRLRGAVAVYRHQRFEVPRPRALLGHQPLGELLAFLAGVARVGGHRSFRFGAAGRDSETFTRLAGALEEGLGLPYLPEEGELLVRMRPAAEGEGWDVLARTTRRPLTARAWRECNLEGGLNSSVAYAMHRLAGQREHDRIFNPMCGSGTLLIERSLMGPQDALVGVDIRADAVACASANIRAAKRSIEVAERDALNTGLPDRSFDLVVADLPWGDAVGSHQGNAALYPAFLQEMDRLTARHGRLCLLTHELRLFERVMGEQRRWHASELFQVASGGHHPRAYMLSK